MKQMSKEQLLEISNVFRHLAQYYSSEARKIGRPKSEELDRLEEFMKSCGRWPDGPFPWARLFAKFDIPESRRRGIQSGIRNRAKKARNGALRK